MSFLSWFGLMPNHRSAGNVLIYLFTMSRFCSFFRFDSQKYVDILRPGQQHLKRQASSRLAALASWFSTEHHVVHCKSECSRVAKNSAKIDRRRLIGCQICDLFQPRSKFRAQILVSINKVRSFGLKHKSRPDATEMTGGKSQLQTWTRKNDLNVRHGCVCV